MEIKEEIIDWLFTFNGLIYKQKGDVSMGSSIGPVLTNIIITAL